MYSELIETYKTFKSMAITVDVCTIGINVCLLIVLLLQLKEDNGKVIKSFIEYTLSLLVFAFVEIGCWKTLFQEQYLSVFKMLVLIDFFLFWIIPAVMFRLIKNIVEYKTKFNNKIYRIFIATFFVLGSLVFIPGFSKHILQFSDKYVAYIQGDLYSYYFSFETLLVFVGLTIGLTKTKEIDIRDRIIAAVFLMIPMICTYINTMWISTVGILFMSLSIIILFGITHQLRSIELIKKEKEKQIELAETKGKLLLAQIQPHFLYNTLTTLKYLCETSPNEASTLCDTFSNYLRANIDAVDNNGLVPFERELLNIENYLKIEKARFGDRVKYLFDIEEKDFAIPVLSIQTIVENAVKKGICKKTEGGTIKIITKSNDSYLQIQVIDDGVGFNMANYMSDGKNHVGLTNTKQRLALIGGEINVKSKMDEGTTVTVIISKEQE